VRRGNVRKRKAIDIVRLLIVELTDVVSERDENEKDLFLQAHLSQYGVFISSETILALRTLIEEAEK
jgi:hypothetical protein